MSPEEQQIVFGHNVTIEGKAKQAFIAEFVRLQRIAQLMASRVSNQRAIQEIDAELGRLVQEEINRMIY